MIKFSTRLIREKITIVDPPADARDSVGLPGNVIRSNRLFLDINQGVQQESIVIRTQSMHVALRLAGEMMASFGESGLFLSRETEYDWHALWESALSGYETTHNAKVWGAIYINGAPAFKTAASASTPLPLIEKYALMSVRQAHEDMSENETESSESAEAMELDHATQLAVRLSCNEDKIICRIFHRIRGRYVGFNFALDIVPTPPRIADALLAAAAFIEIVNLKLFILEMSADAASAHMLRARLDDARHHIAALEEDIAQFEGNYGADYHRSALPDIF